MAGSLIYLPKPDPKSHKGQNGVVLIIGGSRTYHGAPMLAALGAVRFCDLVYFASTKENNALMTKMKAATPNVIAVSGPAERKAFAHADCVLIGNGMEPDAATRAALARVLKSGKRCVLDAGALRVLPLNLLHKDCVLTPHAGEFRAAFGLEATPKNAADASERYGCTILLKGERDTVASNGKVVFVSGGNAGMSKGGTGDVLAGLCAALFSRTPVPMKAAYLSSLLNKKAGEMLYDAIGPNFSSEDLAKELAFAASKLY